MAADHKGRREGLTSWWAVREVDALLHRFGRYTRFVVYSKWGLLAVAGVLTAILIIWPLVTDDKSGIRISFTDSRTTPQAPSSPVMSNPEYRGSSVNGRQYKINGKTATQKTPTLIILDQVEAVVMKPDGGWQMMTADTAEYHQDAKRIYLISNVTVNDNAGTEFVTERATINTETMDINGDQPVKGKGPRGDIVARGFEIVDNGNRINFLGGSGSAPIKVKFQRATQ